MFIKIVIYYKEIDKTITILDQYFLIIVQAKTFCSGYSYLIKQVLITIK